MNPIGFVNPKDFHQPVDGHPTLFLGNKKDGTFNYWTYVIWKTSVNIFMMEVFLYIIFLQADLLVWLMNTTQHYILKNTSPVISSPAFLSNDDLSYVFIEDNLRQFCLDRNLTSVCVRDCPTKIRLYFTEDWEDAEKAVVGRLVQQDVEYWNRRSQKTLLLHLASYGLSDSSDPSGETATGEDAICYITVIAQKEAGGNRFTVEEEYYVKLRTPSQDAILCSWRSPLRKVESDWFLKRPGT